MSLYRRESDKPVRRALQPARSQGVQPPANDRQVPPLDRRRDDRDNRDANPVLKTTEDIEIE